MSKKHYQHKQSERIINAIDGIAQRLSSRSTVFDDFLTMNVCALAGGTMEGEYLRTIQPYVQGEKGKRPIDELARLHGELIEAMEETGDDILGDMFTGGITRGENGQYFTPDAICELMVKLTSDPEPEPHLFSSIDEQDLDGVKSICDPCCGSGRMLLAKAREMKGKGFFVGQDVDLRCVKMCAINLGLHGLNGMVTWGSSLALETKRVFLTGFNGRGVIREVDEGKRVP
jgi:hypothetical protein